MVPSERGEDECGDPGESEVGDGGKEMGERGRDMQPFVRVKEEKGRDPPRVVGYRDKDGSV